MDQQTDYKKVLTEVIKKQMIILGPDITLAKARNVHGLTISNDGTVTDIQGHPQELIQSLIDQFVQLSGLIVKKTMEPLLSIYPDGASPAINSSTAPAPTPPPVAPQPTTPLTNQQESAQNINTQPK
jgi:hypothetical protein